MKNAVLLFVLLSCTTLGWGQTVFSANDLPQIGDTLYFAIDNDFSIPNLQETGTDLSWDFTKLYPSDLALNVYLDPVQTPFTNDFPDANIALRIDFDQPSYSYFTQNDSLIDILGLSVNIEDLGGEQLLKFSNPQLFTTIPTSLGTSFRDTSVAEAEVFGQLIFKTTTFSEVTTDGSGEIKLPGGNYSALRQQVITERRDSLFTVVFGQRFLFESTSETDTIFLWISPESKGIILSTDLVSGNVTYYAPELENLPAPEANFDFTLLTNGPITFRDASQNTPFSWSWDFGDGNTSTQQNPTHEFDSTGTYTVCLTVENIAGTNEACQMISFVTTGTRALWNALPIKVFPNPADQAIRFRLEGPPLRTSELFLYNQYGQMIQKLAFQADQRVDTKDWPTGLYYYQIIQEGQLQSSGQFSISR